MLTLAYVLLLHVLCLSPSSSCRLARAVSLRRCAAGEAVFLEGDPARCMHVVAAGGVGIYVAGQHVREMGPGDHFGELALVNPMGTRAATVVTLEPSELLRIDRSDFQQVTRRRQGV